MAPSFSYLWEEESLPGKEPQGTIGRSQDPLCGKGSRKGLPRFAAALLG